MKCFLWLKLIPTFLELPLRLALILDFQVNSAFNGKRKMLRKSLQHLCSSSEIEAALHKIGSSDLMLDDFVRLHSHLVEV